MYPGVKCDLKFLLFVHKRNGKTIVYSGKNRPVKCARVHSTWQKWSNLFPQVEDKGRVQGIERRLTDKGCLLGGRQRLSDRHEEHRHTEEGADAQGHLLAGLGGHVEHQQRYKIIFRELLTQDIKRLPQGLYEKQKTKIIWGYEPVLTGWEGFVALTSPIEIKAFFFSFQTHLWLILCGKQKLKLLIVC